MQRVLLTLLVAVFASAAAAGTRPQMSGDARIDAQWAQLRRAPAVAPMRRQAAQPPVRREIDPAFLPALVDYPTPERPGTIVIDTGNRYLYLVLGDGKAQRYGVGVGRDGFGWSGTTRIGRKAEWPTWTPPAEMRRRQPYLPVSMPGGPANPLGARALYLHQGGRDTLFRIHGSNEPWTIGQAVSSGCFRMRNEDVVELYGRVGIGTKVVVL
jgi:lipoprotein-anchoring transpeptidase ErfK/SrfK